MVIARRSLALLFSVALLVSALASDAVAAPGQPVPSVQIQLYVQLVTPTVLKVTVTITCDPAPLAEGYVTVNLTQSIPLPASATGDMVMTCDGAGHDVGVHVFGNAFSPGDAFAWAQACTVLACSTDARKVVIR